MIKRLSILIVFLGLCFACNTVEKPKKPDNLIEKNRMVDILFDVFVFNAAKGTNKRVLEDNNVTPVEYIYKKHNIDSLQFVLSNEYYAYDVKEYEDMINSIEAKIKLKKAQFEKNIEIEEERKKLRLDSLKKLKDSLKKPTNTIKRLSKD